MIKKVGNKIGVFVLFISMMLIFSSIWILNTFGIVTVEEIVFTLIVPQEGGNVLSFVISFILKVIIPSLLLTIVLYFLILRNNVIGIEVNLNIKNFCFKNMIYPFNGIFKFLMVLLVFCISLFYTCSRLEILEYIKNQTMLSTLIEKEYVDTKNANISFENGKRNLIYIFLESMESSYTSIENGGTQKYDLINELSLLADENISFSHNDKLGGAQSVPGTTWTVGAMVAQTSGLPLKLSISGNSYGRYTTFLPGAYTLGDLLNDNGYNQKIMFGSDASFGGRDSYFTSHGNYEIFDVDTAIKEGKMTDDDRVWWGFEDKNLFDWAKDEIIELSQEDKPFNFTLLTVDTHFEDGYLSNECNVDYGDKYSNVIACSSKMVYEFVRWIMEQEFYEDTTIVIAGDHLTMDVNYFENLSPSYTRTIYNVFINSVVPAKNTNNRVFTTMDLFPSTLASMGVTFEGDRLGIGTNLFSDKETLAEEYGIDVFSDELAMTSKFYNEKLVYNKNS